SGRCIVYDAYLSTCPRVLIVRAASAFAVTFVFAFAFAFASTTPFFSVGSGPDDQNPWTSREVSIIDNTAAARAALLHSNPTSSQELLKEVKSKNWGERCQAISVLGELDTTVSNPSKEVMAVFFKAIQDHESPSVRRKAIAILSKLGAVAAQRTNKALYWRCVEITLSKVSTDQDEKIRSAAISGLLSLLSAAPQYITKETCNESLDTLLNVVDEHKSPALRCTAINALPRLLQVLPQHIDAGLFMEFHEALWQVAHNKDTSIYQAAARALSAAIQAVPHCANEVLDTEYFLDQLIISENPVGVRCAAASVLSALVAVAPQNEQAVLCERAVKVFSALLGQDQADSIRQAVVAGLGTLAQAVPTQAEPVCQQLLKLAEDKETTVRSTVMEVLGTLDNVSDHRAAARRVLVNAINSWYSAVREAAARALGARVRAGQCQDSDCLAALLSLRRDWYSSVQGAAAEALRGFSTQQLIEAYCSGLHTSTLVPQIRDRLCTQPLVEASISGRRGYYQLTLYQGVGEPVVWEAPKVPIDRLKKAIRRQNPTLSWQEYVGS
ncbi:MAG: HEAT repeat domain-containing protein, partial [Bacteroidota bacterium]